MSFTFRVTKTVTEGSSQVTNLNTITAQTSVKMAEVVADTVLNKMLSLAVVLTELKVFTMQATVDMTVYTNDAGTGAPQETFVLLAGQPVIFETGVDTAIFAGDLTALYVSNTSGASGQLNVMVGVDTP
jgi:hypothetical protein